MGVFELVLILSAAVLASSVLDQVIPRVSSPLIQIALGVLISILSVSPIRLTLDPELFLVLFIAPLLFDEARHTNLTHLWHNRLSVLSLAIGLVLALVLSVGFTLHIMVPSIPLAAALALGAALGPTDAVAVSSLSREISLTHRQHALLGGEALINDASGVVSFQFAIAAAVTGSFSLVDASFTFVVSFFGGVVVGIVAGLLVTWISRKIHALGIDNTTFHVLFEVLTPFATFLVAEALGASGILAVVAAGILITLRPRSIGPTTSRLNIVSSSVWRVLSYLLNGIVFVILGMLLPNALRDSWNDTSVSDVALIAYVLVLTLVVELTRFVWVYLIEALHRLRQRKRGETDLGPGMLTTEMLRHVTIVTLSGAKGAVTLSIVLTTPYVIASGLPFPQRDLIIFLAGGVILCTLLLATFLLPVLAPKPDGDQESQARDAVIVEVLRGVVERLSGEQTHENREQTRRVIRSYNRRIRRILSRAEGLDQASSQRDLRISVLDMQQEFVLRGITDGSISPLVGYRYLQRMAGVQGLVGKGHHHSTPSEIFGRIRFALYDFRRRRGMVADDEASTKELLDVQIAAEECAIAYLREQMEADDHPSEDVFDLMSEHVSVLHDLRDEAKPAGLRQFKRESDKSYAIERRGLDIELELVEDAYESGRLTRAQAQSLRENVYLMRIDLEERV